MHDVEVRELPTSGFENELELREQRVEQREASLDAYVASTQVELQRRERALRSA